jgi:putative ABC transport system ATP-binding protein
METSFQRYIWTHSRRAQGWLLCVVLVSLLPYYLALDLPRLIVNGPIIGAGFEDGRAPLLPPGTLWPAFAGPPPLLGIEVGRLEALVALSCLFLALVVVNGLFKYYINIFKGLLGERLLRRLRYELVDRLLRARPGFFRRAKGAEIATMVKDEVEPLGGFAGDAFVQPAFLGGQALTALAFIFVQHVWLGMIALAMAVLQVAVIPPLRRRLIELGRDRQLTARQLAGRVAEMVDGIQTIHAYDTSNYERADAADRLGTIFRIRFAIYRRKFLVKFLNNFLAQVTPFLFYLVGGYFAVTGRLDVGQLVAVINAYKELPGPLKELIDWDLARQDVQVKYETVVEQFAAADLIAADLQPVDPAPAAALPQPLALAAVTVEDEGGTRLLEPTTLRLTPGEAVAVVGGTGSGADIVGELFGRARLPSAGRVLAGAADLNALPESVSGRRITYVPPEGYFFAGTLRDNLAYGLKHAPVRPAGYSGAALRARRAAAREALRAGNPDLDINDRWTDLDAGGAEEGMDRILAVLDAAHLTDAVIDLGLRATLDDGTEPGLRAQVVACREALRGRLAAGGMGRLVVPFAEGAYNPEATVLDNLLFGVFTARATPGLVAEGNALLDRILAETGLTEALFDIGRAMAETALDLFRDVSPDNPFFARLDFMAPEDLPRFRDLVRRVAGRNAAAVRPADRQAMIGLAYRYVEPQHRFGLLDEALGGRIVAARERLHAEAPARLRPILERYRSGAYVDAASLRDNIVFGRVNRRIKDAEERLRAAIVPVLRQDEALLRRVVRIGLDHDIGAAGRGLTLPQRQQANLARALLRRSDVYVFNRPLSAVDPALQAAILDATLAHLRRDGARPTILWVLAAPRLADRFDRVVHLRNRRIDHAADAMSQPEAMLEPARRDMG